MRDFRDAKAMAQTLRHSLQTKSISISHSESLELVARTLGFHDWNVLSAAIQASQPVARSAGKLRSAALKGSGAIPVTPMRDVVFFPELIAPIFVGREKTRRALASAVAGDKRIFVVTQRRSGDDDPDFNALYDTGVIADIIRHVELPDGSLRVKVSCTQRATVVRPIAGDFLAAEIVPIEELRASDAEAFALTRELLEAYRRFAGTEPPQSFYRYVGEPSVLADVVAQHIGLGIERSQQILETRDVVTRLQALLGWMREASGDTARAPH